MLILTYWQIYIKDISIFSEKDEKLSLLFENIPLERIDVALCDKLQLYKHT